jgi:hydroxyacylglutathione hydrolase
MKVASCAAFSTRCSKTRTNTLFTLDNTTPNVSSMQIQTFEVGILSTNCYIVNCTETMEAIIIDPGFDDAHEADQIIRYVDENRLKVKFIVNTHGHQDHISGDVILKRKYGVPICIHAYDANCLDGLSVNFSPANVLLGDEDLVKFGQVTLKVMHTPGHTLGGMSLVGERLVFTSDTLFAGGIGRTDFAGGSERDMRLSLEKLLCLPDDYVVYPGHGGISTIGKEKRFNPFLRWL